MNPTESQTKLTELQAEMALTQFAQIHNEEAANIKLHRDEIKQHLINGTTPAEGSPLLSIDFAHKPGTLTLSDPLSPCEEAIVELAFETVLFILSVFSLSKVGQKLNKDAFAAMRGERIQSEFRTAIKTIGNAKSDWDKATAIASIFSLIWHTLGKGILDSLKSNMHWYDWIIYGMIFLAQLAASFASGLLYLIGKVVLALDAAVNVIEGSINVEKVCSSQPIPIIASLEQSLNKQMPDVMGLLSNTTPSATELWNELFFFWNGSGNDGIWYTSFDGTNAQAQTSLQQKLGTMNVDDNTSPASCYFNDQLYVFWNNSAKNNISYTTYNGQEWSEQTTVDLSVTGVSIRQGTSPFACEFQGKLYLFWNGEGITEIQFSVFDGTSWGQVQSMISLIGEMGIMRETSPAAVVYHNQLYLFWNGTGDNGFWYATFDGTSWNGQYSIVSKIENMGVLDHTSPSATVFNNKLCLFWNGSGHNGIWLTTFNGNQWTVQTSILDQIGGMSLMDGTNPAAVCYKSKMYSMWNASTNNGIWYATFPIGGLKTGANI